MKKLQKIVYKLVKNWSNYQHFTENLIFGKIGSKIHKSLHIVSKISKFSKKFDFWKNLLKMIEKMPKNY